MEKFSLQTMTVVLAVVLLGKQALAQDASASPPNDIASTSASAQPKAATAMKAGATFDDCHGASRCPKMIVLPSGTFTMGSPASEIGRLRDEEPQHAVTLRAFAVGEFDVTRAEYAAFVRESGRPAGGNCNHPNREGKWAEDASATWENPGYQTSERDPIVCVSWQDAKAYVAWLSNKTGKAYRLLTESEWEYAARAGTATPFYWGAAPEGAKGKANCSACGSQWDNKQPAPVGSFPANAFGLFDMAGNVWQWVEDCYVPNYSGAPTDGAFVTTGDCAQRVMRGAGWWEDKPVDLRSAGRGGGHPGDRGSNLGFRVARTL